MAKTRGRNLAIGLGVLTLLGGSAAFLAVAGHRARALARQQMTFVAAVSHELRTPLAAIRSAGQNLADGVVSDPEQVRRYGAMVHREGERLTALVEQTLELSGMLGGDGACASRRWIRRTWWTRCWRRCARGSPSRSTCRRDSDRSSRMAWPCTARSGTSSTMR